MKKLLFKATLTGLFITLLLIVTCWLFAEQILNTIARPQLERFSSELLAAEVKIGQLSWTATGLEIRMLQVDAPDKLAATVPRLELHFTLGTLWNRQLSALILHNPQLELYQPTEQTTTKPALQVPAKLPLTITQLQVSNGQLVLNTADRQWQLQQINLATALQQLTPFTLAAHFGGNENYPLAATGTLEFSRQATLTLESFTWQGEQLLTAPLQAELTGTEVSLERSVLQLKSFNQRQLQNLLTAFAQPAPLLETLTFTLAEANLALTMTGQSLQLELLVASGTLGWGDRRGRFSKLRLLLDRKQTSWSIAGQLQGPAQTTFEVNARLTDRLQLTGQAQVKVPEPGRLKTELFAGAPWRISGGLQLSADFSLQDQQLQLTTDIQGLPTEPAKADARWTISQLSGRGNLQLAENKEEFSLALQLATQPFFSATGNFNQLDFTLTLPQLQGLEKLLADGQIPRQVQAANELKAVGQFSKKAASWAGKLRLTAATLVLPELGIQALDCDGTMRLTADQLSLQQAACSFDLTRGTELSTQVTGEFGGTISSAQFALTIQHLSLAQLNYSSPDGQTGVGEATVTLRGKISGNWPPGPTVLALSGTLKAKELLAGSFYADLSAYAAHVNLDGEWLPETAQLQTHALRIELPKIAVFTTSGLISPTQLQLQSQLSLADLATGYRDQLRPLLSEYRPTLADLNLAGDLLLETELRWQPTAWQARGTLQLQDLSADWPSQRMTLSDGTGNLPFTLSTATLPTAPSATAVAGEISFAVLSVGLVTLEPGRLQLLTAPNRLSFISPLQLHLAGGRTTIENLDLAWLVDSAQVSANIKIYAVDLETLTKELSWPVMQGRFSADLGTLRYAERQLSSDGLASIEVFGGQFQLRNMRYLEPFSSYPTFYTDIDFSGLDLLQATRTFDFGEINGVLDGYIHGLELFGTTPAAFAAEFTTRAAGKRNISVKALNNLTILSQGGISAALSRGLYQFIDFYRYRMIGIKCSLENDTFTLIGTAQPGSDRYLVEGSLLPPRIDITTLTSTVSFKEMVNRLGRIERTGPSSSKGGQK